jgi:1-acyl-sn-glycerol-3-phosphate acyltransferase
MRGSRGEQNLWWRIGHAVVELLFRALFRIRFVGMANVPAHGPAILAPNHVSVLDPVIIALAPSRQGRTVQFLAAAEFFDKPVVGWMLRIIRQIPLRRGAADWSALHELAGVIRRGSITGIFPEGQVSLSGEVMPGQKGLARVALDAGVPVIPVAIWGTQERWPRSGFRWTRPFRANVVVVYGEPIEASGDPRDRAAVRALMDRVMGEIGSLVQRARPMTR